MNALADERVLAGLASEQRGVFSKSDLQTALGDAHTASFVRRLQKLESEGVLRRFIRGWYVVEPFDLATLSQRIAPDSAISFGTVLARELLIGTAPVRQVMATKVGRSRTYRELGHEIIHLGLAPHLVFGTHIVDGVRYADAEKAVLDVLYFHLRGQIYFFDLYSDIQRDKLDLTRLHGYLARYKNPRFVSFARRFLELE